MTPSEAVTRFYAEVWNRMDKAPVKAMFHVDFTFRGSLGPVKVGHAGFWDYMDEVDAALEGFHCAVQDIVDDGAHAFARVLFSGIHRGELMGRPATGRRVQWMGAARFTLRDGKIADLWVLGDLYGLERDIDGVADELA